MMKKMKMTLSNYFFGLIDKKTQKYYNALRLIVRAYYTRLKATFEQEFKEIRENSRIMIRLNTFKIKSIDILRSYNQYI